MRERSTWNLKEVAKRAAEVAGDIYTMNQDHPQPGMDEYVIGDSSDFAEDVHSPNTWEAEYSGDKVKRNELGMPEMRGDTFNHAEKTASDKVRLKKAELCVAVAKLIMRGKRAASAETIEDQAVALMYMPDAELINTHKRLAQQQGQEEPEEEQSEDEDEDESFGDDASDDEGDDEDSGQQQKQAKSKSKSKHAGEVPPQFKENIEKMKAKSEDSKSDDDEDDEGQSKQAGDDDKIPDFIQKKIDDKEEDSKDEGDDKKQASVIKTIKLAMGQQQQLLAQMQQLLQQAQQEQEPVASVAQQQQVPPTQEPVAQQILVDDGQDDLDQILGGTDLGPTAEEDIELEPAGMDVDNVVLAGEDEILRSLFAQEDEQADEDQGQSEQAKQASVRTASTRTVGTRPTSGVAKLGGGSVSKTAAKNQVDSLSSLWASAPDVRAAFGIK